MNHAQPILSATDLGHSFSTSGNAVNVYSSLNFEIASGEVFAVRGSSGSGKTTLLLACGAMLRPTQGTVTLNGENIHNLSSAQRVSLRAKVIGYMFQSLELIPYLSVLDNVRLAHHVDRSTALAWLEKLGMSSRVSHKPEALSHGQRQRVALARAMAHAPKLVIADEPTGNLDPQNSELVFNTLRTFADSGGSVIVASHSPNVSGIADQTMDLDTRRIPEEVTS